VRRATCTEGRAHADRSAVVDLKGALPPVKHRPYASIAYLSELGWARSPTKAAAANESLPDSVKLDSSNWGFARALACLLLKP
jgi:hypothetical protein